MPEWFSQLGVMGWFLALCSLTALAICFERAAFTIKSRGEKNEIYAALSNRLTEYKSLPKPVRDDAAETMLSELQRSYYSGIKWLRVISVVSPMLGLSGTILGIIHTFQIISAEPGPISPNIIAPGLWEAMLTTAVGLIIAIPSFLMAHLFSHLSERQIEEFSLRLNKLSMAFERGKSENTP